MPEVSFMTGCDMGVAPCFCSASLQEKSIRAINKNIHEILFIKFGSPVENISVITLIGRVIRCCAFHCLPMIQNLTVIIIGTFYDDSKQKINCKWNFTSVEIRIRLIASLNL